VKIEKDRYIVQRPPEAPHGRTRKPPTCSPRRKQAAMTLETRALERAFRYTASTWSTRARSIPPKKFRDLYTPPTPSSPTPRSRGPENKDGKLVYTFRRPVGTKGAAPVIDW